MLRGESPGEMHSPGLPGRETGRNQFDAPRYSAGCFFVI